MRTEPTPRTAEACLQHLHAVLECLDRLAHAEDPAPESISLAAIHIQRAVELIEALQPSQS